VYVSGVGTSRHFAAMRNLVAIRASAPDKYSTAWSSEPQSDGRWPLDAPVASGYRAARSGVEMEPYDQASVV
jgi:hypothetical protein